MAPFSWQILAVFQRYLRKYWLILVALSLIGFLSSEIEDNILIVWMLYLKRTLVSEVVYPVWTMCSISEGLQPGFLLGGEHPSERLLQPLKIFRKTTEGTIEAIAYCLKIQYSLLSPPPPPPFKTFSGRKAAVVANFSIRACSHEPGAWTTLGQVFPHVHMIICCPGATFPQGEFNVIWSLRTDLNSFSFDANSYRE